MKKALRKLGVASALLATLNSASAIGFLGLQATPEVGATIGTQNTLETKFTYGAYGRFWLGAGVFVFGPNLKYDVMHAKKGNYNYSNTQVGAVFGLDVPAVPVVPYVAVNYSKLVGIQLHSTVSVNYGVKIDVPAIPLLTIGLEGTYQKPRIPGKSKNDPNPTLPIKRITATVGLAF